MLNTLSSSSNCDIGMNINIHLLMFCATQYTSDHTDYMTGAH